MILNDDGTIGQLSELYDYRYPKDVKTTSPLTLPEAYEKSPDFAGIVRTHLAKIVRTAEIVRTDNFKKQIKATNLHVGCWVQFKAKDREYLLTLNQNDNLQQLLRLSDSWGKTDSYREPEGLRKIRGDWWPDFFLDMVNVSKEGNTKFDNGKKPVRLLKQLIKMTTFSDSLILDFFSGSATTAHAVLQLNAEDGGHRKFILVQLPEVCAEGSEARRAGFKTICDIGEERIRRAGKKIKKEHPDAEDLDVGFRCFTVDSTNMKDVYYKPADYRQEQMDMFASNIKDDRTPEDLLFQVMLDLGVPLSEKIEETEIGGKKVFSVSDGYLIACFDSDVMDETVTEIAKKKPFYAVFRDSGMSTDSVMANFEQIFETYSPRTVRKVL